MARPPAAASSPLWAALGVGLALGLAGPVAAQVAPGLCDILDRADTPCVAAHSTTRALYAAYGGPLYRVMRGSDGAGRDIFPLAPGGTADAAQQDAFCRGTSCTITRLYDQSPEHNDLSIEGRGGAGGPDRGADAAALPIEVAGRRAYGLLIAPGMGYRDDQTRGVARDGAPETVLMVASGTHVNARCCFDYGNAETSNRDTGNGHMDALNLSLSRGRRHVVGNGPWVQADLENGLFMSPRGGNPTYAGSPFPFVTALLANDGQDFLELAAGDAQAGRLRWITRGPEPRRPGYAPMRQEGAIVLGTGGDNSKGSAGSFFEGVMTSGVATPATIAALQRNIVRAEYASAP